MCNNKCGGCLLAIGVGIIVGIIVAILYFLALIPLIIFGGIAALIFGGIALLIVTALAAFGKKEIERCVCFKGKCLLLLALGTILTITIALSLILTPLNLFAAIIIGIATALFIATLIATFQLVSCIISANCKCREIQ